MPKMTRERRLLMVELEDYPKDLVSKFFAATRNWSNRDARRLAYVQAVKDYQKELEKLIPEVDLFISIKEYDNLWEKIDHLHWPNVCSLFLKKLLF